MGSKNAVVGRPYARVSTLTLHSAFTHNLHFYSTHMSERLLDIGDTRLPLLPHYSQYTCTTTQRELVLQPAPRCLFLDTKPGT